MPFVTRNGGCILEMHHRAIIHTDGAKDKTGQIMFPYSIFDLQGQAVQMHIIGISVVSHAHNAYLRFFQILLT